MTLQTLKIVVRSSSTFITKTVNNNNIITDANAGVTFQFYQLGLMGFLLTILVLALIATSIGLFYKGGNDVMFQMEGFFTLTLRSVPFYTVRRLKSHTLDDVGTPTDLGSKNALSPNYRGLTLGACSDYSTRQLPLQQHSESVVYEEIRESNALPGKSKTAACRKMELTPNLAYQRSLYKVTD